jgi:DNA invertase Pin-like site-specific DNA recombinase
MLIGYARVSKDESNHIAQAGELHKAGCEEVVEETTSGARWDRPRLQALLTRLKAGDTLVVWKVDRLSRSLLDIVRIASELEGRSIAFKSLTENFDTGTAVGRMTLGILATFAQFEREMIRERTHAGLRTAHAAGRFGGRPRKFKPLKAAEIVRAIKAGEKTPAEVALLEDVHVKTVHRLLVKAETRAAKEQAS